MPANTNPSRSRTTTEHWTSSANIWHGPETGRASRHPAIQRCTERSMLKTIVIVVLVLLVLAVVVVLVLAAAKPDTFRVQRATSINAPPEKIFALINDLHSHSSWSPFEKDPEMKRAHSGAPQGKGAVYEWDGNRQVGKGRIEIADTTPPSKLTMKL